MNKAFPYPINPVLVLTMHPSDYTQNPTHCFQKVPISQSTDLKTPKPKSRRTSLKKTFNSSLEKVETRSKSSFDHNFLQNLKDIQEKAKRFLLNQSSISPDIQHPTKPKNDSIEIPILVPLSVYRKSHNLSPPFIHQANKDGEVFFVHLTSDQCKMNDPLVRTKAKVQKTELKSLSRHKNVGEIVEEIKHQFDMRSLSVDGGQDSGNTLVPKEKPEFYMFRDTPNEVNKGEIQRRWVKNRMSVYSKEIKKNFLPRIDERKTIELAILQERRKKFKPAGINKLRIML